MVAVAWLFKNPFYWLLLRHPRSGNMFSQLYSFSSSYIPMHPRNICGVVQFSCFILMRGCCSCARKLFSYQRKRLSVLCLLHVFYWMGSVLGTCWLDIEEERNQIQEHPHDIVGFRQHQRNSSDQRYYLFPFSSHFTRFSFIIFASSSFCPTIWSD